MTGPLEKGKVQQLSDITRDSVIHDDGHLQSLEFFGFVFRKRKRTRPTNAVERQPRSYLDRYYISSHFPNTVFYLQFKAQPTEWGNRMK